MKFFSSLSIEKKLMLILIGFGSLALLLSAVILIIYDTTELKKQIARELSIVAEIIADRSTASLVFNDSESARGNLFALAAHESIVYSCIRDVDDTVFAVYKKILADKYHCPEADSLDGSYFEENSISVLKSIYLDDQKIGLLEIRSNIDALKSRVVRDGFIVAVVFLFSLVITLLSAKRFLGLVSDPIISLSATARDIANNEDYTLRAKKKSNDETGRLVESFNEMLEQIQLRDVALVKEKERAENSANAAKKYAIETEKTNKELEQEVKERRRIEVELYELNETLEERVRERTRELKDLNERIGDIARSAGMAEVASGVLHNVGNVLNSVNVSASVIRDLVRKSKVDNLERVVDMLENNKENLGEFIMTDEKGKQLPRFLKLLSEQFKLEHESVFKELDALANNIDHIKTVISMQQSYAGSYGVFEQIQITDLIEDALKINMEGMDRHHIKIEKEYSRIPFISIDKHKTLQILINLISNAKHALIDSANDDKRLGIVLSKDDESVTVEVRDNGVGISQEDLSHIFEYGFKKRKGGHGYGLHHSALVANELGGQIVANSSGPGGGASFKLVLPFESRES